MERRTERRRERRGGNDCVFPANGERGSSEMDGVWCAPGQTLPAVCFSLPIFLPRANRELSELQLSKCVSSQAWAGEDDLRDLYISSREAPPTSHPPGALGHWPPSLLPWDPQAQPPATILVLTVMRTPQRGGKEESQHVSLLKNATLTGFKRNTAAFTRLPLSPLPHPIFPSFLCPMTPFFSNSGTRQPGQQSAVRHVEVVSVLSTWFSDHCDKLLRGRLDGTGRPVYCTIQHGHFLSLIKSSKSSLYSTIIWYFSHFCDFFTFSVDTADDFWSTTKSLICNGQLLDSR